MSRRQFSQPQIIDETTQFSGPGTLEFASVQEFDSPTGVIEEYYRRLTDALTRQQELRHSTMVEGEGFELQSLEASVVEEDIDAERLASVTDLGDETAEQILSDGEAALVEVTIEYTESGESQSETETWAVATENGNWQLAERRVEEETETESTEQVADAVQLLTEVGIVGSDNTITELRLGVRPANGAEAINLAELTLQYVSDDEFANIVAGIDTTTGEKASGDTAPADFALSDDTVSTDQTRYLVEVVSAEREDDVVMTDNADRYELVIPLADDAQKDLEPLDESGEVEITITTEVGAQTVAFLKVPESLDEYSEGEAVNL